MVSSTVHCRYEFAFFHTVLQYRLLPLRAAKLLAIVLPMLMLVLGMFMTLSRCQAHASRIAVSLLVLFWLAQVVALIRGLPIGCGCFGRSGEIMSWQTACRTTKLLAFAIFGCRSPRQCEVVSEPSEDHACHSSIVERA
jgi:hypothetical protein